MTDAKPKQHGGRRAGAGRKPSLKPLAVLRLLDPQVREQLAELTAQQRTATGNPHLSQEQVVARLIQAAHAQASGRSAPASSASSLEIPDNQDAPHIAVAVLPAPALEYTDNQAGRPSADADVAPGAAAIQQIRREIRDLLDSLRSKTSIGQRDGRRLLALLTALIPLHAAQIAPCAALEELDRVHADDADRDRAVARLLERPLEEYRQESWERDLGAFAAQLATGPIRREAERWALITLAVEISSAAMVTNERSADLAERLRAKRIDPTPWLALALPAPAPVGPLAAPAPAAPTTKQEEITGVRVRQGKSHYLGQPGRAFCGQALPNDPDDATWIRDADFKATCRRCLALFRPTF